MNQLVLQAILAGLILSGIHHFVDRKSKCPKTTIRSLIGGSQGFCSSDNYLVTRYSLEEFLSRASRP